MAKHTPRAREIALVGAFILLGTSCSIEGGLQPGIGVSRSGEDLFIHIAPCLLADVEVVTLGEHVGGSRLPVGLPIYWQVRRLEGQSNPPSKIRAGDTPDGFVATVPFTQPPVRPNPRYNVLIEFDVADVGGMSFQLQEEPGGSEIPFDGRVYNGEYELVSQSAFDSADACDPTGAREDDGILSKQGARDFVPAQHPLADPPTTGRMLLDLTSTSSTASSMTSQQRIGTFVVSGPYRIYAACSGISIQVSDMFSPGPDEVWGQRTVVPCRGGWIPRSPDRPSPGTSVTVVVLPGTNATWRVVAVADTS